MAELVEWAICFTVGKDNERMPELSRRRAEDILTVASDWAVAAGYDMGGGLYREVDAGNAVVWRYRLGLTAVEDGQLIPESRANELVAFLSMYCGSRGLVFDGEYRAFAPRETSGMLRPGVTDA